MHLPQAATIGAIRLDEQEAGQREIERKKKQDEDPAPFLRMPDWLTSPRFALELMARNFWGGAIEK
jgi:hypothetical protein